MGRKAPLSAKKIHIETLGNMMSLMETTWSKAYQYMSNKPILFINKKSKHLCHMEETNI